MISMVEGAQRAAARRTKSRSASCSSASPRSSCSPSSRCPPSRATAKTPPGQSGVVNVSLPVLVALLVCLIPTTIGGLLSAIGISGIDRLMRRNVLATSGRAVEAAGDIDVLLLDKTGTITHGQPHGRPPFIPRPASRKSDLAECRAARLARRRNARGPQHRRAGEGELQPARARDAELHAQVHPVHRADAHERRRYSRARTAGPPLRIRKGAARGGAELRASRARRRLSRRRSRSIVEDDFARAAARRSWWREGAQVLGVDRNSRTWSKAASRSASPSSAKWASARS